MNREYPLGHRAFLLTARYFEQLALVSIPPPLSSKLNTCLERLIPLSTLSDLGPDLELSAPS